MDCLSALTGMQALWGMCAETCVARAQQPALGTCAAHTVSYLGPRCSAEAAGFLGCGWRAWKVAAAWEGGGGGGCARPLDAMRGGGDGCPATPFNSSAACAPSSRLSSCACSSANEPCQKWM